MTDQQSDSRQRPSCAASERPAFWRDLLPVSLVKTEGTIQAGIGKQGYAFKKGL